MKRPPRSTVSFMGTRGVLWLMSVTYCLVAASLVTGRRARRLTGWAVEELMKRRRRVKKRDKGICVEAIVGVKKRSV